jgi:hypothetical protein
MSTDHMVGEWTLHTTVTEPLYAGLTRKVQISPPGVSAVRTAVDTELPEGSSKEGTRRNWREFYKMAIRVFGLTQSLARSLTPSSNRTM